MVPDWGPQLGSRPIVVTGLGPPIGVPLEGVFGPAPVRVSGSLTGVHGYYWLGPSLGLKLWSSLESLILIPNRGPFGRFRMM